MEISRRRFFKLAGGAALAAAIPAAALIPDPQGAWMWADGSWLSPDEFPELFDVIGHTYGLPNRAVDLFRLPDLTKVEVPVPRPHVGIRYLIKVRPNEENVPVGYLVAYTGEELPT